jgi:hypothetical protein
MPSKYARISVDGVWAALSRGYSWMDQYYWAIKHFIREVAPCQFLCKIPCTEAAGKFGKPTRQLWIWNLCGHPRQLRQTSLLSINSQRAFFGGTDAFLAFMGSESPIYSLQYIFPPWRPSHACVYLARRTVTTTGSMILYQMTAIKCAADNESDILRFSPMRNHNLHKLQCKFSEGP